MLTNLESRSNLFIHRSETPSANGHVSGGGEIEENTNENGSVEPQGGLQIGDSISFPNQTSMFNMFKGMLQEMTRTLVGAIQNSIQSVGRTSESKSKTVLSPHQENEPRGVFCGRKRGSRSLTEMTRVILKVLFLVFRQQRSFRSARLVGGV